MERHSDLPALDELGRRLSQAEERTRTDQGARKGTFTATRALLATCGVMAVVAGLSFTPPGQAVARDLGELVGIGDEPTVQQHAANETDAIVIGAGSAPGGQPYEVVASRYERNGNISDDICISLDVPVSAEPAVGPCLSDTARTMLKRGDVGPGYVAAAPEELAPQSGFVAAGVTSADVGSVVVKYRDASGAPMSAPVEFFRLTPELSSQIGTDDVLGVYFAFLPEDLFDSSGTGPSDLAPTQALNALSGIKAVASNRGGTQTAVPFDHEADLRVLRETTAD